MFIFSILLFSRCESEVHWRAATPILGRFIWSTWQAQRYSATGPRDLSRIRNSSLGIQLNLDCTNVLHRYSYWHLRNTNKSGVTGQGMKEAQNINKSLSALGDVIQSLVVTRLQSSHRSEMPDAIKKPNKKHIFCDPRARANIHHTGIPSWRWCWKIPWGATPRRSCDLQVQQWCGYRLKRHRLDDQTVYIVKYAYLKLICTLPFELEDCLRVSGTVQRHWDTRCDIFVGVAESESCHKAIWCISCRTPAFGFRKVRSLSALNFASRARNVELGKVGWAGCTGSASGWSVGSLHVCWTANRIGSIKIKSVDYPLKIRHGGISQLVIQQYLQGHLLWNQMKLNMSQSWQLAGKEKCRQQLRTLKWLFLPSFTPLSGNATVGLLTCQSKGSIICIA